MSKPLAAKDVGACLKQLFIPGRCSKASRSGHCSASGRTSPSPAKAIIVTDMSEIHIDAADIMRDVALSRSEERLVKMTNGCLCCTLREDLLEQTSKLAAEQRSDYPVIESSGISEPWPVAETFAFIDPAGRTPADVARLDTMVTVVDALHFQRDLHAGDWQEAGLQDDRDL